MSLADLTPLHSLAKQAVAASLLLKSKEVGVMVNSQPLAVSLLSKSDPGGLKAEICHLVVSYDCLAVS